MWREQEEADDEIQAASENPRTAINWRGCVANVGVCWDPEQPEFDRDDEDSHEESVKYAMVRSGRLEGDPREDRYLPTSEVADEPWCEDQETECPSVVRQGYQPRSSWKTAEADDRNTERGQKGACDDRCGKYLPNSIHVDEKVCHDAMSSAARNWTRAHEQLLSRPADALTLSRKAALVLGTRDSSARFGGGAFCWSRPSPYLAALRGGKWDAFDESSVLRSVITSKSRGPASAITLSCKAAQPCRPRNGMVAAATDVGFGGSDVQPP